MSLKDDLNGRVAIRTEDVPRPVPTAALVLQDELGVVAELTTDGELLVYGEARLFTLSAGWDTAERSAASVIAKLIMMAAKERKKQ